MSGRRLSVRDYKGSRRGGLDSAWLRPFSLGLVLGLAIAGGIFLAAHRHMAVAAASADTAPAPPAHSGGHPVHVAGDQTVSTPAAPAAGAAAGSSSVAGNAQGEQPALPTGLAKYDFYQMLPRSQVLIPERESEARLAVGATIERPGLYFLQIGSYKDAATADRVRAQAQKLGISANVQRIVVDTATWHRVRVGPIRDLALLNHVRHELQAGNLAAMVVRVNP